MNKIKQLIYDFGILVIRAIWPKRGGGAVQKMVLVVLTLSTLLSVTKASGLQEFLLGKTASSAIPTRQVAQTTTPRLATSNQAPTHDATESTVSGDSRTDSSNIVDLIGESETIITGAVKEVTDGFENGIPYTQVTIEVKEKLRGQVGDEYTFRQFGLTEPRSMGNGKVYIGTTPEGWSKYETGEDAMYFLHKRASITGLQTTTGLGQGKVVFKGGNAISQAGNEGLFKNVEVNPNLVNDKDKRLLATKRGAVNAEGFKSFVRRAVNGRWIEGGKLRHAQN